MSEAEIERIMAEIALHAGHELKAVSHVPGPKTGQTRYMPYLTCKTCHHDVINPDILALSLDDVFHTKDNEEV